jgi:hypothetical protein
MGNGIKIDRVESLSRLTGGNQAGSKGAAEGEYAGMAVGYEALAG